MGAWDERPFCNDSILNDIGGLNYSKSELQNIENVLVEYEHYLGNYIMTCGERWRHCR